MHLHQVAHSGLFLAAQNILVAAHEQHVFQVFLIAFAQVQLATTLSEISRRDREQVRIGSFTVGCGQHAGLVACQRDQFIAAEVLQRCLEQRNAGNSKAGGAPHKTGLEDINSHVEAGLEPVFKYRFAKFIGALQVGEGPGSFVARSMAAGLAGMQGVAHWPGGAAQPLRLAGGCTVGQHGRQLRAFEPRDPGGDARL
ncbi:hypothetical protein D3C79_720520 [compost metagenome]